MKYILCNILSLSPVRFGRCIGLPLLAALCFTSSCVFDSPEDKEVESQATQSTYQITFTLRSLNNASRVTEADESGQGRENYIDVTNTQFLLYRAADADDGSDRFVAALVPEYMSPIDDSNYPSQWTVTATISDVDGQPLDYTELRHKYRLVILANSSQAQLPNTLADLCENVKYDFSPFASMDEVCIPMYGVLTFDGASLSFHPQIATHIGTVDVLRAMAKIEIELVSEESPYDQVSISGARLSKYYNLGLVCPAEIYNATNTWEGSSITERAPHFPSDAAVVAPASDNFIADGNKYVFYVPEYDNARAKDCVVNIKFSYKQGENLGTENFSLKLGEYTDGKFVEDSYFNILRNYYYSYSINLKGRPLSELTIGYTVCSWNSKTSGDIEFN